MPSARWNLQLPDRCEHWRGVLLGDLARLEQQFEAWASRWPAEGDDTLFLVVAADVGAAGRIADEFRLPGDPRVPRTHPSVRLALVPLPRQDELVLERDTPPRTWRETFRHEAAHLLSVDRPGLLGSPLWFQEGFAEGWTHLRAEQAGTWSSAGAGASELLARLEATSSPDDPLLPRLGSFPSEARLAAWRLMADLSLDRTRVEDAEPWRAVADLSASELAAELRSRRVAPGARIRGREFQAQTSSEPMLLAAYPGEVVGVVPMQEWNAQQPLQFEVEVGRSGLPEAGMTLTGAAGQRLRLRFGRHGELGGYLEPLDQVASRPVRFAEEGSASDYRSLSVEISLAGSELRVRSGALRLEFPVEPGSLELPLAVEFYVRNGAMSVDLAGRGDLAP